MKTAIMQPYFFPYIGYWQVINAVDKYVVYDDVAYIKGGWINRNNILLNGNAHLITLPLEGASSFKNINEINIVKKASGKILKTINSAYLKAPYFNNIMPMIEELITKSDNIAELNYKTILEIKKYLNWNTEILLSSEIEKDNSLKAQDKVIHINKILGSDYYINAIGGMKLYSTEDFKNEGIDLKFLKNSDISYKQFNNDFVPNLSIIDILMFNSIEEINKIMKQYSLI